MALGIPSSISEAESYNYRMIIMDSLCEKLIVSKAAADLMAYCEAHAKEDPLLTPVPASENPFREKKFFCAIL
ncbi:hypothetical protein FD755_013650 [Muntiacus reevesi]|uniref:Guanine nucleotide-binding protein subunit gamma n=2 Tax=Muntiacus TaxID=9885 RepID=A0A5N3XNE5_MUNRE|nr:hypothetical protein FD754_021518 [Muntiacus muntjak]KAB0375158.1 hypothetical protein FD755_013650 [Muntiacus reevesi]